MHCQCMLSSKLPCLQHKRHLSSLRFFILPQQRTMHHFLLFDSLLHLMQAKLLFLWHLCSGLQLECLDQAMRAIHHLKLRLNGSSQPKHIQMLCLPSKLDLLAMQFSLCKPEWHLFFSLQCSSLPHLPHQLILFGLCLWLYSQQQLLELHHRMLRFKLRKVRFLKLYMR